MEFNEYFHDLLILHEFEILRHILHKKKTHILLSICTVRFFIAHNIACTCVDCGQEFESLKELEEHETKHQNLLITDKPTTTDITDNPMYSIE